MEGSSAELDVPTTLYRARSATGELLYVGITRDPGNRFSKHRARAPWWQNAATIELQHFRTRHEALVAELEAIQAEAPAWNVHGREPGRWVRTGPVTRREAEQVMAAGLSLRQAAAELGVSIATVRRALGRLDRNGRRPRTRAPAGHYRTIRERAVQLVERDGMSLRDAAEELGASVGTLRRALGRLDYRGRTVPAESS